MGQRQHLTTYPPRRFLTGLLWGRGRRGSGGGPDPLVLPSACVRGDGRLLFLFGVYDTHSANHTETRAPTPKKATMQIRKPRRKPRSTVNNISKKPFPFGGLYPAV